MVHAQLYTAHSRLVEHDRSYLWGTACCWVMLMQHHSQPGFEVLSMSCHSAVVSILRANSLLFWKWLTLITHPGSQTGSVAPASDKCGKRRWLSSDLRAVTIYGECNMTCARAGSGKRWSLVSYERWSETACVLLGCEKAQGQQDWLGEPSRLFRTTLFLIVLEPQNLHNIVLLLCFDVLGLWVP